MNVLVTGGAGYIGTTLVPMLLQRGHRVTVLDRLLYGVSPILPWFRLATMKFVHGDVQDRSAVEAAADGCDAVVHLAAIVGYGACEKDARLSEETNVQGTANVAAAAGGRPWVYASTGSCYGIVEGKLCTEDLPLRPLSVYARTKAEGERIAQEAGAASFRLATAFGLSPRLRLDLLVNEFVHRALHEGKLEVYEGFASRSFIHVHDIARAFCMAVENPGAVRGGVFNVGSEEMNFTKMQICQMIQQHLPNVQLIASQDGADPDKRNYAVSYQRISAAGFRTEVSLEQGIEELARALKFIPDRKPYSNASY